MNKSLQEKLPIASKAVWRIYSAIQISILLIVYVVAVYFTWKYELPIYVFVLSAILQIGRAHV